MAFFTFKPDAVEQATFLPAQDLANAGIKESVLRDLLVQHLHRLDTEQRLMVLACEYTGWSDANRFIDLLAIDEEQNLVVVELKRTKDGGHAELQALRYAAMLSTHTFENVIDALLGHRQKTDQQATRDQAQADLLDFLGVADASEVKLSEMPRIMLISQGYGVEPPAATSAAPPPRHSSAANQTLRRAAVTAPPAVAARRCPATRNRLPLPAPITTVGSSQLKTAPEVLKESPFSYLLFYTVK